MNGETILMVGEILMGVALAALVADLILISGIEAEAECSVGTQVRKTASMMEVIRFVTDDCRNI